MAFCRLGYPLHLKWPNDLLNRYHAKTAGILLEERGYCLQVLALTFIPFRMQQLRREHAVPAGLLQNTDGKPSALAPFFWQALVREVISAYNQTFACAIAEALPGLINPFLAWRGEEVAASNDNGDVLKGRLEGLAPLAGSVCGLPMDYRLNYLEAVLHVRNLRE